MERIKKKWGPVPEAEYDELALELLAAAGSRRKWMIHGEMGAGKTTLVKALCRALQCNTEANSPTYAIVNQYQGQWQNAPITIHHIDLYRLENLEDCIAIGIEEYLDDDSYCFIEWPGIIQAIWPPDALEIKIGILPDMQRNILLL